MTAQTDQARLSALHAVFVTMFTAVETAGEFDEQKWEDLIHAFNVTGRLVFGWPHLDSSEADLFAAIDEIANEMDVTKRAIVEVTADARIILAELREAVGGEEPKPIAIQPILAAEAARQRGLARAAALTPERRREIARMGGLALSAKRRAS